MCRATTRLKAMSSCDRAYRRSNWASVAEVGSTGGESTTSTCSPTRRGEQMRVKNMVASTHSAKSQSDSAPVISGRKVAVEPPADTPVRSPAGITQIAGGEKHVAARQFSAKTLLTSLQLSKTCPQSPPASIRGRRGATPGDGCDHLPSPAQPTPRISPDPTSPVGACRQSPPPSATRPSCPRRALPWEPSDTGLQLCDAATARARN